MGLSISLGIELGENGLASVPAPIKNTDEAAVLNTDEDPVYNTG